MPGQSNSNSASSQSFSRESLDAMMPEVYAELHRIARAYMRSERDGHTLQPTALVNEAYMRLVGQHSVNFEDRSHLIGVAAQLMRRILSTHEEKRRTDKRGGGATLIYLEDATEPASTQTVAFSDLDDALRRFAELDARQAQVMELRIFGGLTVEETAQFLKVSPVTVHRDWATGRMWLADQLRPTR